jgi:DNA recombination protein RmuC
MEWYVLAAFMGALLSGLAVWIISLGKKQKLIAEIALANNRNEMLTQETNLLKVKQESDRNEILKLNRDVVLLDTERKNLLEKLNEQAKTLAELQEHFKLQFENLATKIFDENTAKFSRQNQFNLSQVLDPLKEKIKEFEEKVRVTHKESTEQSSELKEQLQSLKLLGQQMNEEARSLSQALKGDTRKQGYWGELVLERVLEASGLKEGQEYTLQGKGMALASETGSRQMPDAIINLPRQKHIIIDAKVSLTAYDEFISSTDEESGKQSLKKHIDSIKRHISGLSERYYQMNKDLHSPDFVLLFLPIEASLSITLQADALLFDYAWEKKVVLVTPTTLLATLKTIASVWKYEKQNLNAMEIARLGGLMHDQFVDFVNEMEKIRKGLDNTTHAYDEAMKRLQYSSGSLINRAEKLRAMGIKNKKALRADYIDTAATELISSSDEAEE